MASRSTNSPTLGLEASLWDAANRLRSNMDASEYKHVVLGLLFLKYVSDKFEMRRELLEAQYSDPNSDTYLPSDEARAMMLEDRDSFTSEGVFWVPEGHRWDDLRKAAKQPDIGRVIDDAMDAIEKENEALKGILPKNFNRRELSPTVLGGLIDTFSRSDLSDEERKDEDLLGRVYEYMLGRYAADEGKSGGEFYTPRSVVSLLTEMIRPYRGRIYETFIPRRIQVRANYDLAA